MNADDPSDEFDGEKDEVDGQEEEETRSQGSPMDGNICFEH